MRSAQPCRHPGLILVQPVSGFHVEVVHLREGQVLMACHFEKPDRNNNNGYVVEACSRTSHRDAAATSLHSVIYETHQARALTCRCKTSMRNTAFVAPDRHT